MSCFLLEFIIDLWFYSWILVATMGQKNDKIYYINQIPSSFKPYLTSHEEYTRNISV